MQCTSSEGTAQHRFLLAGPGRDLPWARPALPALPSPALAADCNTAVIAGAAAGLAHSPEACCCTPNLLHALCHGMALFSRFRSCLYPYTNSRGSRCPTPSPRPCSQSPARHGPAPVPPLASGLLALLATHFVSNRPHRTARAQLAYTRPSGSGATCRARHQPLALLRYHPHRQGPKLEPFHLAQFCQPGSDC